MAWYEVHGRHGLPWRLTRDPYAVLVSEVMLQQTQVERVLPYFERWMTRWPTAADLAADTPAEAIREWAGLGYNRRALYLHKTAQAAVERHGGTFPSSESALLGMPGIGPYTAAAVTCFAFEQPATPADTNIARVIARTQLGVFSQKLATAATISGAARELLPGDRPRDHNLALMDLGAMICGARKPLCGTCPVREECAWFAAGAPAPEAMRKPAVAFADTARFARGRIIDALREGPKLATELGTMLPEPHAERLGLYLTGLLDDGMVEQDGATWRLPS